MDSSTNSTWTPRSQSPANEAEAAASDDRPSNADEEEAALLKKVDEMVFRAMAKMDAGLPADGGRRTRKVVRLSDEQARKLMAMPWPPAKRRVMPDHKIDRIGNPELREMIRAAKATSARELAIRDGERARMRDQIVRHGYAEMAIEVDEDGGEWMVEL
ncbi:hypothetical protein ACP70R_028931 [Stipagrostis hirtigluma subsp. patula]